MTRSDHFHRARSQPRHIRRAEIPSTSLFLAPSTAALTQMSLSPASARTTPTFPPSIQPEPTTSRHASFNVTWNAIAGICVGIGGLLVVCVIAWLIMSQKVNQQQRTVKSHFGSRRRMRMPAWLCFASGKGVSFDSKVEADDSKSNQTRRRSTRGRHSVTSVSVASAEISRWKKFGVNVGRGSEHVAESSEQGGSGSQPEFVTEAEVSDHEVEMEEAIPPGFNTLQRNVSLQHSLDSTRPPFQLPSSRHGRNDSHPYSFTSSNPPASIRWSGWFDDSQSRHFHSNSNEPLPSSPSVLQATRPRQTHTPSPQNSLSLPQSLLHELGLITENTSPMTRVTTPPPALTTDTTMSTITNARPLSPPELTPISTTMLAGRSTTIVTPVIPTFVKTRDRSDTMSSSMTTDCDSDASLYSYRYSYSQKPILTAIRHSRFRFSQASHESFKSDVMNGVATSSRLNDPFAD